MFQATRRRLALWYTAVTAVLLLLFASGFYLYVRTTLVERVDDTLNHVVEIVERSLVIEPDATGDHIFATVDTNSPPLRVNVEASFRDNAQAVEDDHIDLEWFGPSGQLLWSTFADLQPVPLHVNPAGETVRVGQETFFRQITERVQVDGQVLGYLRVSHPWFEVTKPSRRLIVDLALGTSLMVGAVAAIGWLLSGIAMAPVRDSYQQLKQFTADASHELRNPIAVIQTNAQVALSDPNPDVEIQQKQFQVIERLTRRLGRLVDDLLFLARQESGLIAFTPASLSLAGLLEDVLEEQQVMATERQIALRVNVAEATAGKPRSKNPALLAAPPTASSTILGDPGQLTRLFTNLISNAVQYTPSGGTVTVNVKPIKHQGQSGVQVTVQDTGIGMDSEAITHAFDRFYRADPSRLRSGEQGTGLGLAIAKVIVDTHRGHIHLDSQLGQGTTVTVVLPQGGLGG
ncbi:MULTISPECIES: HAMP domain-containing sensor histidine kinase [Cyanophyceae]|uniref:sensor histidine kinase n=1 Tax=Cyanophyceae TaxID=3028117 RepID=UPI0016865A0F|nr:MULTISPECIES: HAMP domain-containing sensor histidine kinase [Cyanophyceae]MBD1917059.1 HAMP domain-containing histidine kinase [Phormidium sp. FACHB-77]MBD2030590.1 HAMP domain-containing histidine kinase [Phormidium sp. FACHB-322]MBD2050302.1 HAMP domain-containing histidine kinase [Leptolyngbya sp. FACHB-60]